MSSYCRSDTRYSSYSPSAAGNWKIGRGEGKSKSSKEAKDSSLYGGGGGLSRAFSRIDQKAPPSSDTSRADAAKSWRRETSSEHHSALNHSKSDGALCKTAASARRSSTVAGAAVRGATAVVTAPSTAATAAAAAPATLSPAQIMNQIRNAGTRSTALAIWSNHQVSFDARNLAYLFKRFTQLQSTAERHIDQLRGMLTDVIATMNNFSFRDVKDTVGALDGIRCGNQKMRRIFESTIMREGGEDSAHFNSESITHIVTSYTHLRINSSEFILFLNKKSMASTVTSTVSCVAAMMKSFSISGCSSSQAKTAFKAAKNKIAEEGTSFMKLATQHDVADIAHALALADNDSLDQLQVLETIILTGSATSGCVLADWARNARCGANFSKILHAFAKQGSGSDALYTAFEAVLTDDIIATLTPEELVRISRSLVGAGRFAASCIPSMLGIVVGAVESDALDLTSADGKKLLEQLLWIKLSLVHEKKSDIAWGDNLSAAFEGYRREAPSGSITQTAVCTRLKAIYGVGRVDEEVLIEGLDVDIGIKSGAGKVVAAVEVLGPTHYLDGRSCSILDGQTKFRLRLLRAIFGDEAVFTVSTKDWDASPITALEPIQKQLPVAI